MTQRTTITSPALEAARRDLAIAKKKMLASSIPLEVSGSKATGQQVSTRPKGGGKDAREREK